VRFGSAPFDGPQENWELYDIREDFSQSNDLAADRPELLAEMRELFESECLRNGVYPLRDAAMDLPP
jgi:arylsulfatase